jgi:anti-anti-sigma factor
MQIHEDNQGAVTILRPEGPLVGQDAEDLGQRLALRVEECLGRVALDLAAVPYCDSRGLEVLVDADQHLSRRGQSLKVCALSPTLREVMELTGLSGRFEHFGDTTAAIRSFL